MFCVQYTYAIVIFHLFRVPPWVKCSQGAMHHLQIMIHLMRMIMIKQRTIDANSLRLIRKFQKRQLLFRKYFHR